MTSHRDEIIDKKNATQQFRKLPVPDLDETLERYLLCVKPVVTKVQFEKTQKIVEKFGSYKGVGRKLQKDLQEYAKNFENWAYDWWLNEMYMDNRAALPVNSNPGMWLERKNFICNDDRIRFATKLIVAILEYKEILDNQLLPRDVARGQLAGQTLCMKQYYRLLSSYRRPGKQRDQLIEIRKNRNKPEHILIAVNNKFYVMPITNENKKVRTEEVVFSHLQSVFHESYSETDQVGILTSMNRTEWAEARELLIQDATNATSIDDIEQAAFVICFDKTVGEKFDDATMGQHMLHGYGPKYNAGNRWYDKTIQFIIGESGEFGLVYEHSPSEGIAVVCLVEHIMSHMSNNTTFIQIENGVENNNKEKPRLLKWNVNEDIKMHIDRAITSSTKLCKSLDLQILRFSKYGKNFIKKQNMSPDAFIQVILQLAYYKIYGQLVPTYESASTRRFLNGRVDNIRSATVQALEFARSVTVAGGKGGIKLDSRKMLLLRRAIKAQTDYTIATITGHGIDCHLSALREIAAEKGLPVPDIFSDTSYKLCNQFKLSTSQVPTKSDSFMCYGPVVYDGYGVSYNPHDNDIVFCIASLNTCCQTSSQKFQASLVESLDIAGRLCRQWNRRRSSSLALIGFLGAENISLPRMLSIHRELAPMRLETVKDIRVTSSASLDNGKEFEKTTSPSVSNGFHSNEKSSFISQRCKAGWRKAMSVDICN